MKYKKQILSFALAALLAVSPVAAETYGTLPDDEDVLQAHLDPGLCDADGDGGVSLTDALLTLQYAAGKNIGLKGKGRYIKTFRSRPTPTETAALP